MRDSLFDSNCCKLKTINLPILINIGSSAFQNTALNKIELNSVCKSVNDKENRQFADCKYLKYAKLANAAFIHDYKFEGCTYLRHVEFPNAYYIGQNAFKNCFSLIQLTFPQANYVFNNAFEKCILLTEINLSKALIIHDFAFANCKFANHE